MELDVQRLQVVELYKLLIGCVVPRPIAWITSQDRAGILNLAPFSFFNAVASSPPTISVSFSYNPGTSDGRKDTLANIQETGEFVVNMATEDLAAQVNASATDYPRELSEPGELGLHTVPSKLVAPPRLKESPVALECVRSQEIPVGKGGPGSATLVLAEVKHAYIRDGLLHERLHLDIEQLAPIGRLAGHDYCYVHEVFTLSRVKYQDIVAAAGMGNQGEHNE